MRHLLSDTQVVYHCLEDIVKLKPRLKSVVDIIPLLVLSAPPLLVRQLEIHRSASQLIINAFTDAVK